MIGKRQGIYIFSLTKQPHLNIDYLCKDHIAEKTHVLIYKGLGAQHAFGEDAVYPVSIYSLVLSVTLGSPSEQPSLVMFIDCHALAFSEFGAHALSITLDVVEICPSCTDSFRRCSTPVA